LRQGASGGVYNQEMLEQHTVDSEVYNHEVEQVVVVEQ
jgi:hypothetical protein